MWPIDRPPHSVGRTRELAVLRTGAEALRRGEGAVIWVEAGCTRSFWTHADEVNQVLLDFIGHPGQAAGQQNGRAS